MSMCNVIVVDDEMMVKRTLKLLLQRVEGFEWAGEAEDGREALALFSKVKPDVVITDISMPVMNGLELIEKLSGEPDKPEIVILSGYDDFPYIQHAIRFGAVDYLLKPLKPALFEDTMKRVAERVRAQRRPTPPAWQWLPMCESMAKQIAGKVWVMDKEGVGGLLDEVRQEVTDRNISSEHVHPLFADLLHFVSIELTKRGGTEISLGRLNDPHPERQPQMSLEAVKVSLAETMENIRQNRNWVNHNQMQLAAREVERRYTDPSLSMQALSASLDMSPALFSRAFKAEMGVTFVQYLTDKRMEKARQLLSDPVIMSSDAARMAGYSDYPHFTKAFKKHFGLTPSEYRKRLGIQ